MVLFVYNRDSVPVGEDLYLEVQFNDSAGNPKDADATPSFQIEDGAGQIVYIRTTNSVSRLSLGRYRYKLTVPDGYVPGTWNDIWQGTLDGYAITATFDFLVDSQGKIEATGTIVEPDSELGDDDSVAYSQEEIKNINVLLKLLKSKLRNNAFTPAGDPCNVFADDDLINFLCSSLSEFNMTPTITGFGFDDSTTVTLFADILTQGAMLIAWTGMAVIESGREFTITDQGVIVQPPPVSSTITGMISAHLSDYRAKLKEIKRNLRPGPLGMGAGSILVQNPSLRRLRHRRENRII
jgi:hypothetical protein